MIADGALPVPSDLARRVSVESYARLLGYPDGRLAAGRVAALADRSREHFAARSRPWAYARTFGLASTTEASVSLDNRRTFTSRRLAGRLREIGAERVVVAAVSAGAEVDADSARWWREDRPDEAYFLDRFGAAAVIRLGAWMGEHLRLAADAVGRGLGPGYSPGYDGWDLTDQVHLAACLSDSENHDDGPPGPLRVLDSGMIEPKNSLLAVFGVSRDRQAADRQWQRHPCSWCSMKGCTLRGRSSRPGALEAVESSR